MSPILEGLIKYILIHRILNMCVFFNTGDKKEITMCKKKV